MQIPVHPTPTTLSPTMLTESAGPEHVKVFLKLLNDSDVNSW